MWSSSSSSFFLLAPPYPSRSTLPISKPYKPTATAQPHRRRSESDAVTDRRAGELGRAIVSTAAVRSNPRRREREREGEGGAISGSDVLRALQRASARKEKMKEKRGEEELSSARSHREDNGVVVDHEIENVRPLCVKNEWRDQLDELEKRLRELSEII